MKRRDPGNEVVAEASTAENLENLETCKMEYEKEYDYIVRGSIIRSRATWYEHGERNTKYFLNLENSNKKKNCITKLLISDGVQETTDAKEIYNFYSDLYDKKPEIQTDFTSCPFMVNSSTVPKLNDAMREMCEGQLTVSECFQVLSTLQNNKAPGNDGLWAGIGYLLVESLNYSYIHGELSTLQKEAITTLIEKKDRDRRLIKNWRPISLVNVDVKMMMQLEQQTTSWIIRK